MNHSDLRLLVTIDTECDKSATWRTASPLSFRAVTEAIPNRLQPLFADFGVRPTYLLSPEVMLQPECVSVLRELKNTELTTHLHGDYIVPQPKTWDFAGSLTGEMQWEYGPELEQAKLAALTELFRQQFGHQPLSFRAGRFGAGPHTCRILRELGYVIDSSVTPHICWTSRHGDKRPDYRAFPEWPYFVGSDGDISRAGDSTFLELPVTILPANAIPSSSPGKPIWFRPWYSDADTMCRVMEHIAALPPRYGVRRPLVMMFHNVELLAGASPYPQSEAEVIRYLDMLKRVFERAEQMGIQACTMAEYHKQIMHPVEYNRQNSRVPAGVATAKTNQKVYRPELKLSTDTVEAVLKEYETPGWFSYVLRERAARWDTWKPCVWAVENLPTSTPVLSLGCGFGLNLFWLAEHGFTDLQGCDLDFRVVGAGNELAARTGLPVKLWRDDAINPKHLPAKRYGLIEALNWTHLVEGFSLDALLDRYLPHLADDGVFLLDVIDAAYNAVPGNEFCTQDRSKPAAERRPSEYRVRLSRDQVEQAFAKRSLTLVASLNEPQHIPKTVYIARRTALAAPAVAKLASPGSVTPISNGRRPRILLIADVPNWVFEQHARTLIERLGDAFEFELTYRDRSFNEEDYDLVYPLEFTLVDPAAIRNPAKFVTGIRSHSSWAKRDLDDVVTELAKHFQKVHVVSRRLGNIFAPVLPGMEVLSHGVDTSFFQSRRPVSTQPGTLRIGWAGNRKTPTKGFEEYIKPLGTLPGVELVFCGYADRRLTRTEVRDFYDSIDVYVCSSITEGNNNPLLECAAMERALVTTDTGTVPEYLRDGESALVVPRKLEAFVAAIERLRDDPELRSRLGRKARQSVIEHFEWGKQAEAYRRWFNQALQGAGSNVIQKAAKPAAAKTVAAESKPEAPVSLAEVETQARQALALDPNGAEALKLLANVCLRGERWLEAAQTAARLLEHHPEDIESLLILAKALFRSGDRETAQLALERVLAIDPRNEIARANLADLGRPISSPAPASPRAEQLIRSGQEALAAGNVTGAIALLEQALQQEAGDADLMVGVAGLHLALGNVEAARRHLSQALLLAPGHAEAGKLLVDLALDSASTELNQVSPQVATTAAPAVAVKESHELDYWKRQKEREGTLANRHYEYYYTTHFGLSHEFYRGKRVLDLGCGPRGSLEWADMTRERVGLDPLADEYLKLGADRHQMRYVAAPSEAIPFPDGHFDVVTSFNSLDHVADLDQTIREIMRVVKPGGLFLLLTDVNHQATPCEPIEFSWDVTRKFTDQFDLLEQRQFEKPAHGGLYQGVTEAVTYDHARGQRRYGILSAKFRKQPVRVPEVSVSVSTNNANQRAFAHLQRGFDLLKDRRFADAQAESRRYQELIDYDALDRTDNRTEPKPELSVVIVAYKINEGLIHCLDSLAASKNPPHEIIVVDNGGNEAIHAELARRPLLHIRVGFNVILAEGRNIGVHFTRSNYAVFIDDDALAAPGYLAAALEGFNAFDVHAFRGKVLPKSDHPHNSRARHYNLGDLPFPADIDTEGNSAFRIDTWRQLGGQDPLLFGGEGVDLSYRIGKVHGDFALMYWPFMVIQHDYAVTDNKLETKSSRHVLMREYSVFKHPDLYTFHNRLVAFARGNETKAEGNRLLPRHAPVSPTNGTTAATGTGSIFFSVCVPTYNRAVFIEQTLASVFRQTHSHFEIVVVDDGSTDDTAAIMKRIADPRVRYVVKEHSGGPATRNRCVAEAKGEFLVWLDSDDVMLPTTLELYAKALGEHPDVDVLYGHLQVGDEQLNVVERWNFNDYHGWTAALLADTVVENRVPNVCTLVRKNCYARFGPYNPAFPRAHDYEFWTRLAPAAVFKSVNTDVGIYRRHEQSLSKVRKQVDTSFEASAVKAMLERHSLRDLFPGCYAGGAAEAGDARACLLVALLMVKYGDLPAAAQFARRGLSGGHLGRLARLAELLLALTGQRKTSGAGTDDEFSRLLDQAAKLYSQGQVQPCAQACARLTELRPDAPETLLLVGLSLQRWANPHDAKTAFRCLVQRQCELAHAEATQEAVNPTEPSAAVDSKLQHLSTRLAALFAEPAIPNSALTDTLAYIQAAGAASDARHFLERNRHGQTPLFLAMLSLSAGELEGLDHCTREQFARVRSALKSTRLRGGGREPGYSFCIITGGQRREKLERQIASIRALNLPAYEILVGGDVSNVPLGVRKVEMKDAARAGRLGKMRNELGRLALYDHLVVADDDLVFDPGFGAGLKQFGESYDAMAVRIVNADGSRFWDWATSGGTRGSVLLDYWNTDPNIYITGGICVLKTAVLDHVKWDATRGFYECEDVDFSTRLRAAGFNIRFNAFCKVTHDDDRYSRVDRRIYRFDHLLKAIEETARAHEASEAQRLLTHAFRMAGDHCDRQETVCSLAKKLGLDLHEFPQAPAALGAKVRGAKAPANAPATRKLEINWQGSFLDYGSLSNINRVLTDTLVIQNGAAVRRLQTADVAGKLARPLQAYRGKLAASHNANASLTVRHAWPPDWTRPAAGKLAVIQPWEFGSLPKAWVEAARNVDAFWVPSNYVRQVYVDSGVPAEKVHVLPNGIDAKLFRPDAKPLKLATRKSFKFLFVGGTIYRKGPDALLKAYVETFTDQDDVCLVIKDFGGGSVYAGQTVEHQIRELQKQPQAPEILYLKQDLPPQDLPGLYTACDCLAHPYRGEGFGLPVLEAMACGLPVMVTAGGATDDFVPDEAGYKIPAKRQVFGSEISGMPLVGHGWLLEPEAGAIKEMMRRAFTDRDTARAKGRFASDHARRNWTWHHTANRLVELAQACVAGGAPVDKTPTPGPARRQITITLPEVARIGHLGAARALLKQNQLLPAWESASAALTRRPFHPEAWLLLAEIAAQAGGLKHSQECLERARALTPHWEAVKQPAKTHAPRKPAGKVALPPPPPMAESRLSVCLIVKNEEKFLDQCLRSVKGVASQIVVVDTGSTDRTIEIAKQHGAEVHHFAWCDDFSAARNAALEHATGDWVLALDADEELAPVDRAELKEIMKANNTIGWRLPIVDQGREAEGCTYVPRLFRNAPGLFYVSRVHEQVFSSVEVRREEWNMETGVGSLTLIHHGYAAEVLRDRNKIARNLRLLELAIEEIPGDPNLLMNYGLELIRSERFDEGLARYAGAFAALNAKPGNEVTPELRESLLTQYSSHLMKAGRWPAVVEVLTSRVATREPLSASLCFTLGLAFQELHRWPEAAEQFRLCLHRRNAKSFYLVNRVILGGAPRHCLALALWQGGSIAEAAKEFGAALEEEPALKPLQMDAARFEAAHGEPVAALKLYHGLAASDPSIVDAWVGGAKLALSDPDFIEFARDWTSEAIKHHPENRELIAARGETLLLTQHFADALPCWRQLNGHPRALSARLLCELMQGEFSIGTPPADETETSQEFLRWYRRLISHRAVEGLQAVSERLPVLSTVLPSAARALSRILEQAAVEAA